MGLDNRTKEKALYEVEGLDDVLIRQLEQINPHHRKIQFLLDIRGILTVNNIEGACVEYGCYKAETTYMAHKILGNRISKYYGIDMFEDAPPLRNSDSETNSFDVYHPFVGVPVDEVRAAFLDNPSVELVKGDLTDYKTYAHVAGPVSVAVIDCNFATALNASISHALSCLTPVGIVFIDDYFTNMEKGGVVIEDLWNRSLKQYGKKATPFQTYPPFAKAFVVTNEV